MSVKSAFRPCGRDLGEFSKSTRWSFLVNLTARPIQERNQRDFGVQ